MLTLLKWLPLKRRFYHGWWSEMPVNTGRDYEDARRGVLDMRWYDPSSRLAGFYRDSPVQGWRERVDGWVARVIGV